MRRKRFAQFVALVLATATVSAYFAYRVGLSRASRPAEEASPAAPAATSFEDGVGCVDFRDAGKYVGRDGCITGRVLRVFVSRSGNTFLNFCPDYRTCPFYSVIFASDRERFGDFGILRGRRVEIRGLVGTYQGQAQIILNDPSQIRLAE
jgi:hypothetical protein